MLGGIIETVVGVVMIVVPEPATTAAGAGLFADGVRRIVNSLD
jgi:hypothetical protein